MCIVQCSIDTSYVFNQQSYVIWTENVYTIQIPLSYNNCEILDH